MTTKHLMTRTLRSLIAAITLNLVLISLLILSELNLVGASRAIAAPETRGGQGTVVTLGAGGGFGAGTDNTGERSPSQLGGNTHFMIGEEVLPRIFVGVSMDAYFGSAQSKEESTSQLFAFGFEGRYRLTQQARGLILLGGLGIGVGGVIREGETLTTAEDSGGGSVWKVGLGYELGDPEVKRGFIYVPSVVFQRLGPQMESEVSFNLISLNLEVLYATGR